MGALRLPSLADLDRRTAPAKRARELIEAIEGDLGGADRLSSVQRQLIRRLAMMLLWCESEDADALGGQRALDAERYGRVASHARRIAETLGVERVLKDVTPTLSEYLDAKARERTSQPQQEAS